MKIKESEKIEVDDFEVDEYEDVVIFLRNGEEVDRANLRNVLEDVVDRSTLHVMV